MRGPKKRGLQSPGISYEIGFSFKHCKAAASRSCHKHADAIEFRNPRQQAAYADYDKRDPFTDSPGKTQEWTLNQSLGTSGCDPILVSS
ncbi:hypothetical protein MASR2M78_05680 [Treponema sp.]